MANPFLDVHAEDELLDATLRLLRARGVTTTLCVGDICDGRGDLARCVDLLQEHNAISVRGNHERWMLADHLRNLPDAHLASELDPSVRSFLAALPPIRTFSSPVGTVLLCHGLGDDDMASVTSDDFRSGEITFHRLEAQDGDVLSLGTLSR